MSISSFTTNNLTNSSFYPPLDFSITSTVTTQWNPPSSSNAGLLEKWNCNSKIAEIFELFATRKDSAISTVLYQYIQACLDTPPEKPIPLPPADLQKASREQIIALLYASDIFSGEYWALIEMLHGKKIIWGLENTYLYDLPIPMQKQLTLELCKWGAGEIKQIFELPIYANTITLDGVHMSPLTFVFAFCSTNLAKAFVEARANVDEADWNLASLDNKFIIITYTARRIDILRLRSIDFYHDAVRANRIDLVRELFELGRVRVDDESLKPPVSLFSKRETAISIALKNELDEMVALLVEYGATIPTGQSPLETASFQSHHRRVERLLNSKRYSQEHIESVVTQLKTQSLFQKFATWWESKQDDPERNHERTLDLLLNHLDYGCAP